MHKCTFLPRLPKNLPKHLTRKCRQNHRPRITRLFSTTPDSNPAASDTRKHETLTLQHKTENLLESVFNIGGRSSDNTNAAALWRDVLSDTFVNLSTAAERPARVVVCGIGEWSGAEDLVTALLDEPLNSDHTHADTLRTRWKDVNPTTGLTISSNNSRASSSIRLSSSYLEQFSVPLEITELRSSSSPTQPLHPALFKADVPIIVFNPLTTPLSYFQHLHIPSHTIFVSSSNPNLNNTAIQRSTQACLLSQAESDSNEKPQQRLFFVEPSLALSGIEAFRSNPASTLAIQQYQENFTASGISLLTKAIRSSVESRTKNFSPGAYLRNRTALIQLHDALSIFYSNVKDVQQCLDNIREGVSQLNSKIEEMKVRVPNDILGLPQSTEGAVVRESLRLASKELQGVFERLTWLKTISRVDEISEIVGGAVDRAWCKDLEQKLILQTGRLLTLQEEFANTANALIQKQAPLPTPRTYTRTSSRPLFTTHVLQNTLSQLTSSKSYTLNTTTLMTPITKRKLQLLKYPTTRLHLTAQGSVVGMFTGIFASSGYTWAGCMGYLSAHAAGEASAVWSAVGMGMDPTTGIGVGLLGLAGSVRWAMGRWEREKKRWWADWERIGQGLERDLKAIVDKTIEDQVVITADTACKGLVELCEKRQEEVNRVRDEVVRLQTDLKDIISRTQKV